ncbi:unnamed protein product [Brassicogethes aeneus]|uniref:Cilia- and flagella-associated protein 263 n=1 Tax=Brassicogethes aeneus TaxID=1431903 RepID=A0A9P0AZH2_BRAAE|nr:unnamed protein product [Brassicogethes aeneus]
MNRSRSTMSGNSAHYEVIEELEELPGEELVELYNASEIAYKYVMLENKFLLLYIEKNDPILYPMTIKRMELLDQKAKDSTKPRDSTESGSTDGRSSQLSANTARSFIRHSMIGSGSLSVAGSTVSGNTKSIGTSELRFRKKVLTHFMKTEMLLEIMEGSQKAYNSFKKSSNGILETYRAETEEAKIYIGEGQISLDTFEQTVVVEGLDRISQRIPAEKWLKYMNNWTRQGQFIVQKLLLHKNNEAITLRKLKSVLKERQLLAENIHAVDFDQLTIENKNLKTKIDQRSKFVKELKKLNGWANVILSNSRYFLQSQFNDISQFKFLKEQSENRRENIDKESVKVQGEIEDAKKKYEECKTSRCQIQWSTWQRNQI